MTLKRTGPVSNDVRRLADFNEKLTGATADVMRTDCAA
jgi:hypothetical protein